MSHSREVNGTWNRMIDERRWHFDPFASKAEHQIIARLTLPADVDQQVEACRAQMTPKTLGNSNRLAPATSAAYASLNDGNAADARRFTGGEKMAYASVGDQLAGFELPECCRRIMNLLPLDDCYGKLHVQNPGEVWPMHFDNYNAFRRDSDLSWEDPGVRRLLIAMGDWRWGQMIELGNSMWTQWRAGDVLYFDWLVPHGSANCGIYPRTTLVVTGRVTNELRDWLKGDLPRELHV